MDVDPVNPANPANSANPDRITATTATTVTPPRPQLSEPESETSILISMLILLSVVSFVVTTFPLDDTQRLWLRWFDSGVAIAFGVEYGIRLWFAPRKWAFVASPVSVIDLIVIVELTASLLGLPMIQGLRGVRLLRLLRFFEIDIALLRIDSRDRIIFARIVFTLAAIVTIFAGPLYEVEHPVNPEAFSTVLDAIYFAIVTMTTVGFGDMTPVSSAGRLLTVLMILTGVALIPWQIGQLIEQLVKTAQRVTIVCDGCGRDRHDRDAQFCKQCGTALTHTHTFPPTDSL